MASSHTTELTEQLVKDYGNYAKVDWSNKASVSSVSCCLNNFW